MFAKQCKNPSSGPPTDSTKLLEIQLELPFKLSSKSTMAVLKGQSWRILKSHGAYSNPATQVWAYNKNFRAIL